MTVPNDSRHHPIVRAGLVFTWPGFAFADQNPCVAGADPIEMPGSRGTRLYWRALKREVRKVRNARKRRRGWA